jgi:hypothetical protein
MTNRARKKYRSFVREIYLLKEIFTKDLRDFHNNLLILTQRLLPNKLHDLTEIILLLEDITSLVAQVRIAVIEIVEERLEDAHVLGVGDEPVERREVLPLGELLVETPEHLDDGESGSCYWITEISTGGRDSADDGDCALSSRRSETRDTA